ncbi:MAG: hypothetical protein KDA84_30215 [Planctomycetaceae bacterium]|nr:hypothetical protein [Planctomycetaceae bacterium]
MGESSANLHEPIESLKPSTLEHHRALVSLMEELEAIDWYQQRIDATDDEGLKALLTHNRDEEKEHAAMALEWLRRRDPALDAMLRQYLFTEGPIHELEHAAESGESPSSGDGSLGIGSLRST